MTCAPINPADINIVQGKYPRVPPVPAVAGAQGVGVVEAVGNRAGPVRVGDVVAPVLTSVGTWRSYGVFAAEDVRVLPSDIKHEYLANLSNACTALRMLEDFVELRQGDTLIQNAANSLVGTAVYQMARERGVRTINVIRNRPDVDTTIERMKANGADIVITEDLARGPQFRKVISELPRPRLALNGVGGPSALGLSQHMAPGGTLVTYGAMGREPVTVSNAALLFDDIRVRGFWMTRVAERASGEELDAMNKRVCDMIRDGHLRLFLERHPLSQLHAALQRAAEPYTSRKVVLKLDA